VLAGALIAWGEGATPAVAQPVTTSAQWEAVGTQA
jgi:hypothetical protein